MLSIALGPLARTGLALLPLAAGFSAPSPLLMPLHPPLYVIQEMVGTNRHLAQESLVSLWEGILYLFHY